MVASGNEDHPWRLSFRSAIVDNLAGPREGGVTSDGAECAVDLMIVPKSEDFPGSEEQLKRSELGWDQFLHGVPSPCSEMLGPNSFWPLETHDQ
jgi:hypothetical protein